MGANVYLVDFLKYMLVRDPQHRPSIATLIDRYHSLYQLLLNDSGKANKTTVYMPTHFQPHKRKTLDELVEEYSDFISSEFLPRREGDFLPGREGDHRSRSSNQIIKIMEDIYFLQGGDRQHIDGDELRQEGITHIIVDHQQMHTIRHAHMFKIMAITSTTGSPIIYRLCPHVSDILRQVLLFKGKLLFISGVDSNSIESSNNNIDTNRNTIANLLLYTLSYWFKCPPY